MATRSLEPGTAIARYRVLSLLGAGGMGEVYLARDESLDRSVALKVLPPDLVTNDERVRRFVQEAKSASSLNHPHIVTIYEIGEAEVGGADGPAGRIHFIAMELVSGHTMKTLIHQEKMDLRLLVRYLAQAADGLAKAHAAGIVHRDLKPENIMVTSDGFAKVVDFGLAKLTETSGGADPANAPTELGRVTGAGMVLGTVGYMSPEQVQGKTVDHRSDIFSLGCVLYEAATRQRPFQADSDVETLHKILKDAPPPVEALNPNVPADLRRVIRRCLAKSPDRRLQSMKDVAIDLGEIDGTWETLSVPTGSDTTTSAIGAEGPMPRSRLLPVAAMVIGLAGLGFGAWQWLGGAGSRSSSAALEVTTVARIPDMTAALMSADGRFLAFTQSQAGRFSLVVRQMATNQDVVVVPPQEGEIWLLAVAPDSSYVYFTAGPAPWRFYRVPAVGGEPRRILEQGQVLEVAMSADGSRLAAVVQGAPSARRTIVIANADGTEPRTLASFPVSDVYAPAWSPDGRHVVVSVVRTDSRREQLTAFATSDGKSQAIGRDEWSVFSVVWLAEGHTLIVGARDWSAPESVPLWAVSWPDGATRRITNDSNAYDEPMVLSADGQTITTTLVRADVSLYGAPADRPDEAAPLPGDAPGSGLGFLTPLPNGRLLYRTFARGPRALWTMTSDGTRRQRVTPERMDVTAVDVAARADVIVVETAEDLGAVRRLWRMDASGGGLAELPGGGSVQVASVSPDGAHLFYRKRDPATSRTSGEVWRRPIGGGTEEQVGSRPPVFSPDGRLLYRLIDRRTPGPRQVEIAESETGRVLKTLTTPSLDFGNIGWAPTSDALLGIPRPETVANIWRVPIDGGPATQLTRFGPGQFIPSFTYTADGKLLFLRPERASGEVVQFRNFR